VEALALVRRALQTTSNTDQAARAYNTLGLAEYRNDHWDAAISSLNRSVELHQAA
jgi:uncharacterized protein HemY